MQNKGEVEDQHENTKEKQAPSNESYRVSRWRCLKLESNHDQLASYVGNEEMVATKTT